MGKIDEGADELARFLRQLAGLHESAAVLKEAGGLENFVAEKRKILDELEAQEKTQRAALADITKKQIAAKKAAADVLREAIEERDDILAKACETAAQIKADAKAAADQILEATKAKQKDVEARAARIMAAVQQT